MAIINSPMIISIKFIHIVIQTTEGRKNLGNINVDVHEILRFALDDKWFIHHAMHPPEAPSPLCGQG